MTLLDFIELRRDSRCASMRPHMNLSLNVDDYEDTPISKSCIVMSGRAAIFHIDEFNLIG